MLRVITLTACLLLGACGSNEPAAGPTPSAERYVQSAADRDLFARDPERQAARTIMLGGCADGMKQTLAASGTIVADAQIADVCECQTDMRTRKLSTAQILEGEVGPDDGTCNRWMQPPTAG